MYALGGRVVFGKAGVEPAGFALADVGNMVFSAHSVTPLSFERCTHGSKRWSLYPAL